MAISETYAFCLKKVMRISSANRARIAVGAIINSVLTNLAILRYYPHNFLISFLNLSVSFKFLDAPYAYETKVSRAPFNP